MALVEAHHGKRPVDEINGMIKNVQIKVGKFTISTSAKLCRAANKRVPSIKPLFHQKKKKKDILEE